MNLPGVIVDLPTLTRKDEEDLVQWGIPNDIDFIAASFVRKGEDLDNIHRVCCCFLHASTHSLSAGSHLQAWGDCNVLRCCRQRHVVLDQQTRILA